MAGPLRMRRAGGGKPTTMPATIRRPRPERTRRRPAAQAQARSRVEALPAPWGAVVAATVAAIARGLGDAAAWSEAWLAWLGRVASPSRALTAVWALVPSRGALLRGLLDALGDMNMLSEDEVLRDLRRGPRRR